MTSQSIVFIIKNKTLILAIMALVLGLGLFLYFRAFLVRRLIKKVLKHNNLWIDKETSVFSLTGEVVRIKNYKMKTDHEFEVLIEVLEQETKQRYFYTRNKSVLKIKKFPPLPKEHGIYLQSAKDGEVKKYSPVKNSNGLLIAAKSGAGKSILIKNLLGQNSYSELLIISPKGNEDFENGVMPTAEVEGRILEMISLANSGEYKSGSPAIIVLDEIITLSKIFKKETIEKINISLTVCRSQNLRFWIATQKLNKVSASIDISLPVEKVLNVSDIKNFYESLGIERLKTSTDSLRVGEFIYTREGVESVLINKLAGGEND